MPQRLVLPADRRTQSGASSVEYAIVLAFIAAAVALAVSQFDVRPVYEQLNEILQDLI